MSDDVCISKAEYDHLLEEIKEVKHGQRELWKVIVGNGHHDESVCGRISRLEFRLGSTPSWQWIIEKTIIPVSTAIATAAAMYFIFGAP